MKHRHLFMCLAVAGSLFAGPALAQGRLGLLAQGEYVCALPGTAAGAAWEEDPSRHFTVTGASSYKTSTGSGTYLLEGRALTFTRGPMKGLKMMVMNSGLLQEVDTEGRMSRLRCHRARAEN